jgi:hypothetical protein
MPWTRGRQLAVVGGLGVVLAGVLIFRADEPPAEAPQAPASAVSGTAGAGPPAGQTAVADVRLEMLNPQREDQPETTRNPFRFQPKAPPPSPPRAAAPVRPQPVLPQAPQGPPPPPPIPLRMIGLLDAPTQAGRVAILSDGRGNVFNGREGDIIEGRYRVLRIGPDNAELAYVDGRGRQVIRLSGQ